MLFFPVFAAPHPRRPSNFFPGRCSLFSLFSPRVFHNSFAIRPFRTLSKNCRVSPNNSHSGTRRLPGRKITTRRGIQVLLSHTLPHSFVVCKIFCGVGRYVAQGTRFWLGMHANGPRRHIIPIKGFAGTAYYCICLINCSPSLRRQSLEKQPMTITSKPVNESEYRKAQSSKTS
jgi:hypothetical protein